MKLAHTFAPFTLSFVLLFAGCDEESPPRSQAPAAKGLRADAPPYAVHGPYWVGYRRLEIPGGGGDEPLEVKVWYPARNPTGAEETMTYQVALKFPDWQGYSPQVVHGRAIANAPIDDTNAAYPLVVFSHGYGTNPEWYSTLVEHYASHGLVVLAPEHRETDWFAAWAASFDRPIDIKRTLDFAEALTAPGGTLAGRIDVTKVAVVGHSYGGYTALAMAGARMELETFNARCAALAADDPKTFLCAPFVGREQDMAARAGLTAVPVGLWPPLGDARVKAIVPMAGDAYLFNEQGLASIAVPVMAMGGTADWGTPWEWGARLSYDGVASAHKALVGFEIAGHMIAANPCADMPWTAMLPAFEHDVFCLEPVWEKLRALDLINHFSTAFLLDVLAGDPAAHEALLSPAVNFLGISYTTSIQPPAM